MCMTVSRAVSPSSCDIRDHKDLGHYQDHFIFLPTLGGLKGVSFNRFSNSARDVLLMISYKPESRELWAFNHLSTTHRRDSLNVRTKKKKKCISYCPLVFFKATQASTVSSMWKRDSKCQVHHSQSSTIGKVFGDVLSICRTWARKPRCSSIHFTQLCKVTSQNSKWFHFYLNFPD